MPVTADAAREMLDMYYMVVDNLQEQIIQSGLMGSNPAQLLDSINKMKDLMGLGWMRRKLKASADNARERGYKRIDIDQIVNIDPFESKFRHLKFIAGSYTSSAWGGLRNLLWIT